MRSGKSMDNPVTQARLSAERFDLRHPCPTQSRELAAIIGTTNEKPFTNIIPNQGDSNGTPLQYSCLENPMGGGTW